MEPLTLAELASAVGARPPQGDLLHDAGDRLVGPGVCIDSRKATAGSLFVAFDGEHVEGHDYIAAAADAGAAAALCERVPEGLAPEVAAGCLVVDSAQAALGRLARHVVDRAADPARGEEALTVFGVTGSAGKTSTKDLLAQLLEPAGETVAPVGSFNNEIGLPLTATGVGLSTRFLISEMGARGIGHISYLCGLTPPRIGIVLNVGQAHVGEFGSQERIAEAKGELVEALPADGWAVLNATDPLVREMRHRTRARVAMFAAGGGQQAVEDAELAVWASDVTADELDRHSFTMNVRLPGVDTPRTAGVRLALVGRHQVANAVAAATAAIAAGVDPEAVARALTDARARSRWRMELSERADGVVVINDAYNANPDSMIAAIEALAAVARARRRTRPQARTWAVLGQMFELGETAAAEHEATGRAAGSLQVDHVVALGENAPEVVAGARAAGCPDARVATDRDAVMGMLDLGPDDLVLVKASRAVGLEKVAEAVLADDNAVTEEVTADADDTKGEPR
ncbi:UDP-N-acetylmuramoyl-tripeptide--D-alanyl-D-alanine ligase [Mariniluteicoccus endophyticus]